MKPLPRPSWPQVRESILRYEATALKPRVRAWLEQHTPESWTGKACRSVPTQDLYALLLPLHQFLFTEVGTWLAESSWQVGNESFGGCVCHSFFQAVAASPRSE